ncbi:hypothetical protein [Sphingomonas asaccharolytica]|nr:hypothetical protein [Sphingomonas asaccharolytica]
MKQISKRLYPNRHPGLVPESTVPPAQDEELRPFGLPHSGCRDEPGMTG